MEKFKKFEKFEIEKSELIFGGELVPTYVGEFGDFYDTDRKISIFLTKWPD